MPVSTASPKSAENVFILLILTGAASSTFPILSADPGTTNIRYKQA